ncbi:MAG: hypothetical protein GF368_05565 [Candidatus Aenigmarchaeota archaeon]|nr:hypothetical protein [Candidatus Aenigmarchaeota archaeon]
MNVRSRVAQALQSGKIDSYIAHQYGALPPGTDLTTASVAFLVEGVRPGLEFDGSLASIGNIYPALVTWDKLPDLVADPSLRYFEASR